MSRLKIGFNADTEFLQVLQHPLWMTCKAGVSTVVMQVHYSSTPSNGRLWLLARDTANTQISSTTLGTDPQGLSSLAKNCWPRGPWCCCGMGLGVNKPP